MSFPCSTTGRNLTRAVALGSANGRCYRLTTERFVPTRVDQCSQNIVESYFHHEFRYIKLWFRRERNLGKFLQSEILCCNQLCHQEAGISRRRSWNSVHPWYHFPCFPPVLRTTGQALQHKAPSFSFWLWH